MKVSCGGGKYKVTSHKGKNLSKCMSSGAADKRLAEVEMFKHMKNKRSGKKKVTTKNW